MGRGTEDDTINCPKVTVLFISNLQYSEVGDHKMAGIDNLEVQHNILLTECKGDKGN